MKNIIKILTALATIAGAVYIIATYGEQIVAWAKKLWSKMPKCPCCEEVAEETEFAADTECEAEAAEETAAEEVPVEDAEEAPEVVVSENEPVAAEEDFAE